MKKFLKVIACLYAGIVAVNALEAEFIGGKFPLVKKSENKPGQFIKYINIELEKVTEPKFGKYYHKMEKGYTIQKVRINKKELEKYLAKNNKECEEITLKIPGKFRNEQVYIEFRTFDELKSGGRLKLKLKFTEEKDGTRVKLSNDCFGMFMNSDAITEIDLSEVDPTPNVTGTSCMFHNCPNLESIKFGSFNTANVTEMFDMFSCCPKLTNLTLDGNFNTQNVKNMTRMFAFCDNLKDITFGNNFDTRNVTSMRQMFLECKKLSDPNFVKNFDTQNVTDMHSMFSGCSSIQTLDLSNFNTKNVNTMFSMFADCSSLLNLEFGNNFDTHNVTDMAFMFSKCRSIKNLDLKGKLNTENVKLMRAMFSDCESLENVDVSGFNTQNVIDMASMFSDCKNLVNLDLSNFDTKNVECVSYMFSGCINLQKLNLHNFDTKNLKYSACMYMFKDCQCLENLDITEKFNLGKLDYWAPVMIGCHESLRKKLLGYEN